MALILSLKKINKIRPQLSGVVLAGGAFDIIHGGHIDHLREAKSQGKVLIVHVTSDKRVKIKKGPLRPFFNQDERAKIISAISYVDYVFIDDVPHYDASILKAVMPDILFLNQEAVSNELKKYLVSVKPNIKVVVSESPKINDSSKIIERLEITLKKNKKK